MMKCDFCNTSFPDGTKYCPQCSAWLVKDDNNDSFEQTPYQATPNYQTPMGSPSLDYNENHGNYPPPQQNYNQPTPMSPGNGYTYDHQSGQYYITKNTFDVNNTPIRQVTYYNPVTKMYSTVNYPSTPNHYSPSYTSNKSSNKTVLIVIGCVVGLLIILSIVRGITEASRLSSLRDSYDPYDDYNYFNDNESYDSYSDYSEYFDDTSEIEIRDDSLLDSDIKPLYNDNSVGNGIKDITLSSYYNGAVEYSGCLYFLHGESIIVKYDTTKDTNEILLDVGSGNTIGYFNIVEGKLIYSTDLADEYSDTLSYYEIDLDTYENTFMFYEEQSRIEVYDGYIYLLGYYNMSVIKVGKNTDGDYVSKSYDMGVASDLSSYSSYTDISDGFLYFLVYDYDDTEAVYKTNLSTFNTTLIFQGEYGQYYDDLVIVGSDIYYSKYSQDYYSNSDTEDIVIAKSVLGKKDSETTLVRSTFESDSDFVFLRNNDSMYYSEQSGHSDTTITKTALDDLDNVIDEIDANDTPYHVCNDWFVLYNEYDSDTCYIVNAGDLTERSLEIDSLFGTPLVDFD